VRKPHQRVGRARERAFELPQRSPLHAVRIGAGLHHRHHVVRVVRARIGDDARLRQQLTDLPRRRDPVEDGHLDVHQHDVGPMRRCKRDRLLPVLGLGDDFDPRLARETRPERPTGLGRIVADQQAKH
jgi:hypothetical protein